MEEAMRKLLTLLIVVPWLVLVASVCSAQTETYEFVTEWGGLGSGEGEFGSDIGPRGLTVDDSGNLYVCDYGNQRIQVFTTSGTFQRSFHSGYCAGVTYSDGNVYYTRPAGSVCKYTTAGTQVWVRSYSAPGWTLNGICLDSDGNLHVCDGYDSKVYKIDTSTGDLIKEYPAPEGAGWIAADKSGHVYIASGVGPILRYTNDGVYDDSRLDLPQTERAESITLDGDGNIFIGTLNHLIRKYDSNWSLLAEWGGEGSGPGQFTNPGGIAVDDQGYVYVSDGGGTGGNPENRRTQVFKPSGQQPPPVCMKFVGRYPDKSAHDLKIRDNLAYVTSMDQNELYVLDISDPVNPALVDTHSSSSPPLSVTQVSLIGQYAYVSVGFSGFDVIDVSEPASLAKVGPTRDTPGYVKDIEFANNHAFVVDREGGVLVYNVADPSDPIYVTTYSTSAWATSMAISGNYLYVGIEHSPYGIEIFDITYPDTMNRMCSLSGTNSVMGLGASGTHAFLGLQWSGDLRIVDALCPASYVGTWDSTHGEPCGIAISGDMAFLGERGYGLQVLDISDLAKPLLLDEYSTGGDPLWGAEVVGDYVYLADGPNGVAVVSIGPCCCGVYTGGMTGNTNCDTDGKRNLADITKLIDRVYISQQPLCCEGNGNTNGDPEGTLNLADITKLIDHVYVSHDETAPCL
jgi:streptogramin lyase